MKKSILIAAVVMFCEISFAGYQAGTITSLNVRSDGLTYVYLSGTKGGSPACAINPYWMIKNESSASGKAQYAMLLSAQLTGTKVSINGSNQCTRWYDGEDIGTISIP